MNRIHCVAAALWPRPLAVTSLKRSVGAPEDFASRIAAHIHGKLRRWREAVVRSGAKVE